MSHDLDIGIDTRAAVIEAVAFTSAGEQVAVASAQELAP